MKHRDKEEGLRCPICDSVMVLDNSNHHLSWECTGCDLKAGSWKDEDDAINFLRTLSNLKDRTPDNIKRIADFIKIYLNDEDEYQASLNHGWKLYPPGKMSARTESLEIVIYRTPQQEWEPCQMNEAEQSRCKRENTEWTDVYKDSLFCVHCEFRKRKR